MKTKYLKKVKGGYVCANCGAAMIYVEAEGGWTDHWYECTGCYAKATD
ncbi:hypothetical protein ES705_28143 [subsurface metagenome]